MLSDDSDDDEPQPSRKRPIKSSNAPPKEKQKTDSNDTSPNASDEGVPVICTRNGNAHVRGGEPYGVSKEPLALDFSLTAYQRERRRQTMRNRTAPQQIGDHLIATGWNVDRACHRWHAGHMQALGRVGRGERIRPSFNVRIQHSSDGSGEEADSEGFQESDDFIEYPHEVSSERERRRLAAFLWKFVEEVRELCPAEKI